MVNYALKKAIVEASFVLNKAPYKVNWIDNVEQNRVRKLLKIQLMDNHLPTAVMTQKTKTI
jgi:hypothetical protein